MLRPDADAFARRLRAAIDAKRWRQCDLARAVWGTETNRDGHTVARGRHRISAYCRGGAIPIRPTLNAIAAALGVEPEELLPPTEPAEPPPARFQPVGQGTVRVTIDAVFPTAVASQIMALLAGATDRCSQT